MTEGKAKRRQHVKVGVQGGGMILGNGYRLEFRDAYTFEINRLFNIMLSSFRGTLAC